MRRVKLNRPPPVSSKTAKEIVSDNTVADGRSTSRQDVLTQSQTGDVSAVDISVGVEKSPGDTRLIVRKDIVEVQEDVRRAVEPRRTVVQDDSDVKKRKKKRCSDDVVSQTDTVQISLSGNGGQSSCTEQHIVANTDTANNSASVEHKGNSKQSNRTTGKTLSNRSEPASDVLSKGGSERSFGVNSGLPRSSQETVTQSGSLLDDVLKGFLVQKLAVIESERKATDVNRKDEIGEAVSQNELKDSMSLISKSRRRTRSRESHEQRKELDYACADVTDINRTAYSGEAVVHNELKDSMSLISKSRRRTHSRERHDQQRDLDYRYLGADIIDVNRTADIREAVIQNELKDSMSLISKARRRTHSRESHGQRRDLDYFHADVTDVNRMADSREAVVVHNEPKGSVSLISKSRRRTRSRESHEKQRDLDFLHAKLRDRDETLHHYDAEYTQARSNAHYMKSPIDTWPYRGHYHLPPPPHSMGNFIEAENVTERAFGAKVNPSRRGHRKHMHSLLADKHLLTSGEKNRQYEHGRQSYNFPELQRSQFSEQKSFDCIEQIRQFVSHSSQKFSHDVSQKPAPLAMYDENTGSETGDRERRKSGNSDSHRIHHHHHHHHKKQNTAKQTTGAKLHTHKCVKHGSGKKRVQAATMVQQRKLASQKLPKHKHKHHHGKSILPDTQVSCSEPDVNAALYREEPKGEDDTFNKGRSLSPLGSPNKHHKKHSRKKKHDKKTVSQTPTENVPLLPEKSDPLLDKISSDEDFVPMKVQKTDESDAVPLNALHKMDMLTTSGEKKSDTSAKSTAGLKYKFLKISGKRPKYRMKMSDTNTTAEVPVPSDHVHKSDISVEEHPVQPTIEDKLQTLMDTATDHDTAHESMAPCIAVGQDDASQTVSSHEVSALPSLNAASEQAQSCSDADDGSVSQMKMVNADQVSDKASDERHICSAEEMNSALQKSSVAPADNDDLTEASKSGSIVQVSETEHRDTVEKTGEVAKELSTHEDSVSTSIIASPNEVSCPVSVEELKSYSEDSATDEACKSVSETPAEFEPEAVQENTFTKEQVKDTEKVESEKRAASEEGENNADGQSVSLDAVSPAKHSPLQPNQTASTEALATCDVKSSEGSSALTAEITTENIRSSNVDDKVDESRSVAFSILMGPPLALPRSLVFKKPRAVKMSLRITNTSADIISSGERTCDKKAENDENREEGNAVV